MKHKLPWLPEVIIVKKCFPKKIKQRKWKLKHLKKEFDADFEEDAEIEGEVAGEVKNKKQTKKVDKKEKATGRVDKAIERM